MSGNNIQTSKLEPLRFNNLHKQKTIGGKNHEKTTINKGENSVKDDNFSYHVKTGVVIHFNVVTPGMPII